MSYLINTLHCLAYQVTFKDSYMVSHCQQMELSRKQYCITLQRIQQGVKHNIYCYQKLTDLYLDVGVGCLSLFIEHLVNSYMVIIVIWLIVKYLVNR